MLAKQPDFVAAMLVTLMGPDSKVAKRDDFETLGIPTYLSPSACTVEEDAKDVYGRRAELWNMDLLYKEIEDMAKIFDVADRGQEVIADFKAREAALRDEFHKRDDLTFLFWFSSPSTADDAYLAGGNGPSAYIADLLGGSNAVTTTSEWPSLGWEGIIAADPTVIVAAQVDRKRWALDEADAKIDYPDHRSYGEPDARGARRPHLHHERRGNQRQHPDPSRRRAAGRAASGQRPEVTEQAEHAWERPGRLVAVLALVLVALAFAVALATAIGDFPIGLGTVVLSVTNRLGLTAAEVNPLQESVVWDLRLSRALVAALAGAGLALCGAILQALLRNPLAEPFVLGISAGASTGAVCVIVLGIGAGSLSLSVGAFVGRLCRLRPGRAPVQRGHQRAEPHDPGGRCHRPALQRADLLYRHHFRQCAAGARRDVLAAWQLRRRALARCAAASGGGARRPCGSAF